MFASVDDVITRLNAEGYVCGKNIATVVYLATKLGKPVLVEGPAGVGKTELAKVVALATGRKLIRLQCYEGLDEAKALYEWEYSKQLLYTQIQGEVRRGNGRCTTLRASRRVGKQDNVLLRAFHRAAPAAASDPGAGALAALDR
jgi:MoxR-like ATPase